MNYILPLLILFGVLWWASGSKWLTMKLREVHGSISHELNDPHTVFSAETTKHNEAEFVNDGAKLNMRLTRIFRLFLVAAFVAVFLVLYVAQVA